MNPPKCLPALVLAGFCNLASVGCSDTPPKLAELPPPGVTVSTPLVIADADYDEYSGYIRGFQETEIKARVTGFLPETAFPDGGEVKSGAVLFKIDPRVYVAEFAKAVASETRSQGTVRQVQQRIRPGRAPVQDRQPEQGRL
jgi:multidrug efflux pump subunit AcrA (membrane-fusion protein)